MERISECNLAGIVRSIDCILKRSLLFSSFDGIMSNLSRFCGLSDYSKHWIIM